MKTFLKILLLLLVLVVGGMVLLSMASYSEGERAGTVSKFSKRGYVFKTWEGELLVGGFSEGTGQLNAEKFYFSVTDSNQKAIDVINEALRTGRRVTLKYKEKYFRFFWIGDTAYLVQEASFSDGRPAVPATTAPLTP